MANAPDIRASDAERERVAGQLRDHAAEGRLDVEELDDRLRRAYAARTRAELDALISDLPAPAPQRTPAPARRRPQARDQVVAYAAVMMLLVAIWALTGAGYFWPVWPALGWGVALVTGKGHMHRPHRPHRIL